MVKFYQDRNTYSYSFPAVTLAYFLRYPNPKAVHVISTDVISRHLDPTTNCLHTTRLHLKKSRIPTAVMKLLPKSLVGGTHEEGRQSYVLETSVVDMKTGTMRTESRNLEWRGVLSVREQQEYAAIPDRLGENGEELTDVVTTMTFSSRLGQAARRPTEAEEPRMGFFKSWTTAGLQRAVESAALNRSRQSVEKSAQGMRIVLDRLRRGGLVAAVEGMRQDSKLVFAGGGS